MCMMTQKGDPYIRVFSTLSEVRMLSCILSQLNILCTSLVNPSQFTHYGHFTCSPTYWPDFIEAECSIYQTVQYLSGVRIVFWILPQIDILCTSAVKRYYAKIIKKWQFTIPVSPVFPCNGVHGSKKNLPPASSELNSIWTSPYSGKLYNKNCVVKTSKTLIVWSASCYTVPNYHRVLKRAAMDAIVFGYT